MLFLSEVHQEPCELVEQKCQDSHLDGQVCEDQDVVAVDEFIGYQDQALNVRRNANLHSSEEKNNHVEHEHAVCLQGFVCVHEECHCRDGTNDHD